MQLTEERNRADAALAAIDELKTKAETLVGALGRTGLSGGFQQWEASERKQANAMRIVAIVFGVLAALAVIGMLAARENLSDDPNDVDVVLAVSALAVPAAFGGIAAYAARSRVVEKPGDRASCRARARARLLRAVPRGA